MAAYRRVDDLTVTCRLTACTPGSAPGPTLGIEYGKPLPFTYCNLCLSVHHHIAPSQFRWLLQHSVTIWYKWWPWMWDIQTTTVKWPSNTSKWNSHKRIPTILDSCSLAVLPPRPASTSLSFSSAFSAAAAKLWSDLTWDCCCFRRALSSALCRWVKSVYSRYSSYINTCSVAVDHVKHPVYPMCAVCVSVHVCVSNVDHNHHH